MGHTIRIREALKLPTPSQRALGAACRCGSTSRPADMRAVRAVWAALVEHDQRLLAVVRAVLGDCGNRGDEKVR